ncbi:phosphatidate cytidylyltransferase [Sulfolobus tengchongensis]|uniref:Phosphatidate cytidylyltransferase n=1 Tax=Sulfolobus tengchongensis TaxID=207809 RepID=A0AAX4KY14_9CREN
MIITINDIIWGVVLTIWVGVVVLYFSKMISKKFGTYVSRKAIHMLGGGIVAVVSPLVFTSPIVPIFTSYLLMSYLIVIRILKKEMNWFMEKENLGEVFFTFSFGTILLIMLLLDNNYWSNIRLVYVAILPLIFMSFGDGITGIIRNFVYKRRVKGFWGSIGMLIFCTVIGYFLLGLAGVIAGIIATIAEILPYIDDNLSVPFLSFLVLYLFVKVF